MSSHSRETDLYGSKLTEFRYYWEKPAGQINSEPLSVYVDHFSQSAMQKRRNIQGVLLSLVDARGNRILYLKDNWHLGENGEIVKVFGRSMYSNKDPFQKGDIARNNTGTKEERYRTIPGAGAGMLVHLVNTVYPNWYLAWYPFELSKDGYKMCRRIPRDYPDLVQSREQIGLGVRFIISPRHRRT